MENNHKEITYDGKNINIQQYINESDKQFKKRLEYIRLAETKHIKSEEAIRLSKVWHTYTYKHCKYNKDVYCLMSNIIK